MVPSHPAWIGLPAAAAAASIPATSCAVALAAPSNTPGLVSSCSVTRPAVIASGLPDSVPAWYIGPAGATCCMMARLPA